MPPREPPSRRAMICSRSAEVGSSGGRRRSTALPAVIAVLVATGTGPLAVSPARAAGTVTPLFAPRTGATSEVPPALEPRSDAAPAPAPAFAPTLAPAPTPTVDPSAVPSTPLAEHGDAEPAPLEPPPAGLPPDFAPRTARHRVAVSARFAYRLGSAAEETGAHAGFGFGGTYEYTYATPASRLELALGTDFSLDRFGSDEKGTLTEGGVVTT